MKLPTKVFSHCLAHGTAITPDNLRKNLAADQQLGYGGMVTVPVLIGRNYSLNAIIKPFRETKMSGLVCGLIPGDGPSPFVQPDLVLISLRRQARFAAKLADEELGPPVMVGPLHTHHRQELPANWSPDMLANWLDSLDDLARKLDLKFLLEGLNPVEDKTPNPFETLYQEVASRENLGLHLDLGHFHAQGHTPADFGRMASMAWLVEFANRGRWPLNRNEGIKFPAFTQEMGRLPDDCMVGVEPFCKPVIQAFGLQALCDTTVPGTVCLELDAAYLRTLGVMTMAA